MAHIPAVTVLGTGFGTFWSLSAPAVSGITTVVKGIFTAMQYTGAAVALSFPISIGGMLAIQSIHMHHIHFMDINGNRLLILKTLAVTSCAALYLPYVLPFRYPIGIPYLRLLYTHTLLMAAKDRFSSNDEAIHFFQVSSISWISSCALYTAVKLSAGVGINLMKPLTILAALPLIVNTAHRRFRENAFLATYNQLLQRNTHFVYALPITLGVSTGSLAGIAVAVAYVSLIVFSSELVNGVSFIKAWPFDNIWHVKVQQGVDVSDPQLHATLNRRISHLPQEHRLRFGDFVLAQTAEGVSFRKLGFGMDNEICSDVAIKDLSLVLNMYLPCLQVTQFEGPLQRDLDDTQSPIWGLRITKADVDFGNPKIDAILRTTIKFSPYQHHLFRAPLQISIDDPDDLDDPRVQRTLQAILEKESGASIVIQGFVKIYRNKNPQSTRTIQLLPDGDFTKPESLRRLQMLLNMSPTITGVDASVLGDERIVPAAKIRAVPGASLLPPNWILPAIAGWVSTLTLPNGLCILDHPPQKRIALFDPSAFRPLSNEPQVVQSNERILSHYCGVKRGESPLTAIEWAHLLNGFFADHLSTARSREMIKEQRQIMDDLFTGSGIPLLPPVVLPEPSSRIISRPGLRITEEVLSKWPSTWSQLALNGPQTSLEVEPGITLSWTRQEDKGGLIDHTGWSLTIDLQSISAFSFDLLVAVIVKRFPFISTVRIGDCSIPAIHFKDKCKDCPNCQFFFVDESHAYVEHLDITVGRLKQLVDWRKEPITTIFIHGLPPFPRSQLRDWPDNMELSTLTRQNLMPTDPVIGKDLQIDRGILRVLKPEINGVTTFFRIKEILEESPMISHVNVHGFNLDRSLFTSEYLQMGYESAKAKEPSKISTAQLTGSSQTACKPILKGIKKIHAALLFESPILSNLYSTLLVQDKVLGSHIVLNEEQADFFAELSKYVTNPDSVILTLDNVDEWRRKAHYCGVVPLEKKCDIFDPDGKWHISS
jgi:hypothetical protein